MVATTTANPAITSAINHTDGFDTRPSSHSDMRTAALGTPSHAKVRNTHPVCRARASRSTSATGQTSGRVLPHRQSRSFGPAALALANGLGCLRGLKDASLGGVRHSR